MAASDVAEGGEVARKVHVENAIGLLLTRIVRGRAHVGEHLIAIRTNAHGARNRDERIEDVIMPEVAIMRFARLLMLTKHIRNRHGAGPGALTFGGSRQKAGDGHMQPKYFNKNFRRKRVKTIINKNNRS